eukprot:jgi/Pico_ML_1/55218/g945.t1
MRVGSSDLRPGPEAFEGLEDISMGNLDGLKDRDLVVPLAEFFKLVAEQEDPDNAIEEPYKVVHDNLFRWRAFRRVSAEEFDKLQELVTDPAALKRYRRMATSDGLEADRARDCKVLFEEKRDWSAVERFYREAVRGRRSVWMVSEALEEFAFDVDERSYEPPHKRKQQSKSMLNRKTFAMKLAYVGSDFRGWAGSQMEARSRRPSRML